MGLVLPFPHVGLGLELRSSGLAASSFNHLAPSPAPHLALRGAGLGLLIQGLCTLGKSTFNPHSRFLELPFLRNKCGEMKHSAKRFKVTAINANQVG